jgi:hypothetical protein
MAATKTATQTLSTFCATCPAPETVTAFLQGLGLRLDFQLGAVHYAAYQQLPDLPAQYHYRSPGGESCSTWQGRTPRWMASASPGMPAASGPMLAPMHRRSGASSRPSLPDGCSPGSASITTHLLTPLEWHHMLRGERRCPHDTHRCANHDHHRPARLHCWPVCRRAADPATAPLPGQRRLPPL